MALEFKTEEVELYSAQQAKEPNEYVKTLQELADKKNEKLSILFENDPHLKTFKYAAGKLREKGLYFTFRKDKEKKETHSRVWWLKEAPIRKEREKKAAVNEPKGE